MNKQISWTTITAWVFMGIVTIGVLYPFVWLFISTFKLEHEFMKYPPTLFAETYTLFNYKNVWASIPLISFFKNTVIFSVSVMVLSVFFDSMAGYAFARIRFKTVFAVNRGNEPIDLTIDLRDFNGGCSVIEHIVMNHSDLSAKNTSAHPFEVSPRLRTDTVVQNRTIKSILDPYSWNVIRIGAKGYPAK